MVHELDLSNRGHLVDAPLSVRIYERDLDWLRAEARRQGISIATVVRLIIAKHVDSAPKR